MAYSAQADLLKKMESAIMLALTDDDGSGAIDDAVVNQAVADADGEIDGYLGSKYAVPLTPVPAIILKFSVDIAVKNLYSRRPAMGAMPEDVRKDYDNAVKFLKAVATGNISLGANDPDGTPNSGHPVEVSADNPERVFARDDMEEF